MPLGISVSRRTGVDCDRLGDRPGDSRANFPGDGSRPRRALSAMPATARFGMARRAGTASPSWRAGPIPSKRGAGCLAILTIPTAATSRQPSLACWSAAITCPTAIRRPVRSSISSSDGLTGSPRTPKRFSPATRLVCSLATSTSCLPISTSTSQSDGLDDALFRPEVRDAYRLLVAQGWTDALRTLHPDERIYAFWDYFRNAYGRDAGLRIDHILLSPSVAHRLKAAGVDRDVRGWEKASDHAPTWVELTNARAGPRIRR
jgi:hypothetical protein